MAHKIKQFLVIGLVACITFAGLSSFTPALRAGETADHSPALKIKPAIPLDEQPFFPELQRRRDIWSDNPIGEVVSNTPQETLLNFYAAMAIVGTEADRISQSAFQTGGLRWSKSTQHDIEEIEHLFEVAVKALDSSDFPESVRHHFANESAIEIKHLLDYIFTHTEEPLGLIVSKDSATKNLKSLDKAYVWRLPGSPISLSNKLDGAESSFGYYFTTDTVNNAAVIYEEISGRLKYMEKSQYITPTFYKDFIHTPGNLVPPKWYAGMPIWAHRILEREVLGKETLFQTTTGLVAIIIYALIATAVCRHVSKVLSRSTSKPGHAGEHIKIHISILSALIPFTLLTKLTEGFVDGFLNLTGPPLVITTFLFEILFFTNLCAAAFFTLEAIGRLTQDYLFRKTLSSTTQTISRRRQAGAIMPVCRTLAAAITILLVYRLLLLLGLSSGAVLALSAVPGLAIGLGASKLLGNLFAGFSIQIDQHLRLGEFCQVGDTTGFVKKIGLRSIQLQTLDSTVTIPNAAADESVIVNYNSLYDDEEGQGLSLNISIDQPFTPWQTGKLIELAKNHIRSLPKFKRSTVSIDQNNGEVRLLVYCLMTIERLDTWDEYLLERENLLIKINKLITQLRNSQRTIRVAFNTSHQKLQQIPTLVRDVVNEDPHLKFEKCEFLSISEFSYDFKLKFMGDHQHLSDFQKSVDAMNQRLVLTLKNNDIEIPYPTTRWINSNDRQR
jgi:MscS family membrane protein